MAKSKSVLKFSGKVGGKVHSNGKYGSLVRDAPESGARKKDPVLKKQNYRTAYLNSLAGELNGFFRAYGGNFKQSNFYQLVQKRFRQESLDNRFLLLKQLEGMEVNARYPLHKLGDARIKVNAGTKKITVELAVSYHPPERVAGNRVNVYEYQVLLICWQNRDAQAFPARKRSDWISLTEGLPDFDFIFDRPADTAEWLVCLRLRAGFNKEPIPAFAGEGMRIISVGTFNKKDMELFKKRKEEKDGAAKTERAVAVKTEEQVERVKAKRKRPL